MPKKQKTGVSDTEGSPIAQGLLLLAQELRLEASTWEAHANPEQDYADGLRAAAQRLEQFVRA